MKNLREYIKLPKECSEEYNHIVLLSSGYDSTRVLKLVVDAVKSSGSTKEIHAIYLKVPGIIHGVKISTELSHCRKIIKYIKNTYGVDVHFSVLNISADIPDEILDSNLSCRVGDGLYQPSIWVSSLAYLLPYIDKCIIHYSLVQSDSAPMYIDSIITIFENIVEMYNKDIKINFPLMGYTKLESLMRFKDEDEELMNLCWCCELPSEVDTPCGHCSPCIYNKLYMNYMSDKDNNKSNEPLEDVVDDDVTVEVTAS